MVETRP